MVDPDAAYRAMTNAYRGKDWPDVIEHARALRGWLGAEPWRWRHVLAWKKAMEQRYGHAWIEEFS